MKNFINVRIQGVTHIGTNGSLVHNIRTIESRNDINNNINYFYNIGAKAQYNNDTINSVKLGNINRNKNREILQVLKQQYKHDRLEHNKFYHARRKQNLKSFHGSWGEGVLTFSEAIHKDLDTKYSKDELAKIAMKSVEDICRKMGATPKYLVLHLSELTPHFHFGFSNYDEQGRSLTHKHRNSDFLSNLQDIAYDNFKVLGMDRGIKKEISGVTRYQTTKSHQEAQISSLNHAIHDKKMIIQDLNIELLELKEAYTNLNKQKNEIKDIRKAHSRTSEEYKSLTTQYKSLVEEEKSMRGKYRALKENVKKLESKLESVEVDVDDSNKYERELRQDLKKFLKEHIAKNKANKYEFKDINAFFDEMVEIVNYASNMDINLKELETLKKKFDIKSMSSEFLGEKSTKYATIIQNLSDNLDRKIDRINELSNEKKCYEEKSIALDSFLDKHKLLEKFEKFISDENLDIKR